MAHLWDSFLKGPTVPDNFLPERGQSKPSGRERLLVLMLRYLLDTNITIYVIKQRPICALRLFNENADSMAISAITLAKLLHGAEKSTKTRPCLSVIEKFYNRLEVIAYEAHASWLN